MKQLILGVLSLILINCSNIKVAKPLSPYSEIGVQSILYGSIEGIPSNYTLTFRIDYTDKNGKVKQNSINIGTSEINEDDAPVRKFAFFLPYGDWNIKGVDISRIKKYSGKGLLGPMNKHLTLLFKMKDPIDIPFITEKRTTHYFGRWVFTGLSNIDELSRPQIKIFTAQKIKEDVKSEHEANFGIAITNSENEDKKIFNEKYSKFSKMVHKVTIPEINLKSDSQIFELIIRDLFINTYTHSNNILHL